MNRFIIVSNRLPLRISREGDDLSFQRSVGGLATGLSSFYKEYDSSWIGWPGMPYKDIEDKIDIVNDRMEKEDCVPVYLTEEEINNYYLGFCNKTIWPLCHYFTQYPVYDEFLWNTYKKVNEKFCDAVMKVAEPNDTIWVHDYHLMLLPKMLRDKLPNASIGFFFHIPFPAFEVFRLIPWSNEIIEGLLGADLVGFHTYDYVRCFLESAEYISGYEHTFSQVRTKTHNVKVDAFPMGIDYERFAGNVQGDNEEVEEQKKKIKEKLANRKVFLSVDRLDYSKGITRRLEAIDLFFERNPQYIEKVSFVSLTVPSRTKVEHYASLKRDIDELVGRINGKYGTLGWSPIWYLYRALPFPELLALYNSADIALITPLRDGMNLVTKEVIATNTDNLVVIVSEMAGVARELGEALFVNPNDLEGLVSTMERAITMEDDEQKERIAPMQDRFKRYNVTRWAHDFIKHLSSIKETQKRIQSRKLTSKIKTKIIDEYNKSNKKLVILDYEGTITPIAKKETEAKPEEELRNILKGISNDNTKVLIVSGRNKESLEKWFGDLDVGLSAEHGIWYKKDGEWKTVEPVNNEWKNEVKTLFDFYVDRTPGSFIEEKDYSLVWNFREVIPKLGEIRANELKNALDNYTRNLNLEVIEGYKIVEIKNAGINKSRATDLWLKDNDWDFIMCIGNDITDEVIFESLPEKAYTIKVGSDPSGAKFYLNTVQNIRKLLEDLQK
ncbi:MAG: bifunctional alpha,alpha-trehalose-phosphate synthase (UDP-forming)/trehalose-phosphatase [Spirochaetota bacterium]